MKSVIRAFILASRVPIVVSIALAVMLLESCGQDPSFKENKAGVVPPTDPSADANAKNVNNGTTGGAANGGSTVGTPSGASTAGGTPTSGNVGTTGGSGSSGGITIAPGVINPTVPTVDGVTIVPGSESTNGLTLVTDQAVQPASSPVDILWIVDSSGSMAEEQAYLGQNFATFINSLAASVTDFQTGITTTDICADGDPSLVPMGIRYCPALDGTPATHFRGSLVGTAGQRVLSPSSPNLVSKFLSYANVGTTGSSFEHGLTAAQMAVAKSLAGQNEGLVRPNAFLSVIVISDEEDDGIGLGSVDQYSGINYVAAGLTSYRYTDDNFISYLQSAKGAGKFSVSAITGTRNHDGTMCTSPHSQPREEGTQYIKAAQKTGGVFQSICDTNWSATLGNIGQDMASQSSQIVLSARPYATSIKVFVNGVETSHWTYNSGNNAVKMNPDSLPPAGAHITVTYYKAP